MAVERKVSIYVNRWLSGANSGGDGRSAHDVLLGDLSAFPTFLCRCLAALITGPHTPPDNSAWFPDWRRRHLASMRPGRISLGQQTAPRHHCRRQSVMRGQVVASDAAGPSGGFIGASAGFRRGTVNIRPVTSSRKAEIIDRVRV